LHFGYCVINCSFDQVFAMRLALNIATRTGIVLLVSVLSGCIGFRSTDGPMQILEDKLNCPTRPKTLIVFLPGAREVPQDLVTEGFVKQVRDRQIQADMQILDSHYAYFSKLQIIDRLENEVMLPARAKGYSQIWFAGISLGGFGTLMYGASQAQAKQPDPKKQYDGFFVMAPYMGEKKVWEPIQAVGLAKWQAPTQGDFNVDLWRWLARYSQSNTPEANLPSAYIGYGTEDFLAPPNKILGDALPKDRQMEVPGGHDWPPWKTLWGQWLDRAPLARASSANELCQFK
jgi:hypothetical protein